ncbi:MAG: trypsin-like peptidase domain-containing protein [Bacteroidales bacterium]|nr:trypsin-like peptidase domain-containing protein [Bacteroidales bacterium]
MKRAIQFLTVLALTLVIAWGVKMVFFTEKDDESEARSTFQDTTRPGIIPATYLPVMPFNGPDFTTAAEKTVHGVVHIRSEFTRKTIMYDDFFGPFRELFGHPYGGSGSQVYTGFGSGVIISNDGYIVTNNHVVESANNIDVILNDRREFKAVLIGTDPSTDLALVKIEAENLPYLTFGNSDEVKIGEWVLAVGNPFNLTSTVTAGIVSAKARNINILGSQGSIESFIQTDAAVNRGNSGGALVNMKGELVGINAAIASNTGSYTGYSFAIPVNIVRKVADDLLNYGMVQRAYLGVTIRQVNSALAREKDLSVFNGVFIETLTSNGGAKQAGVKSGDVITGINNIPVTTTSELLEIIGQQNPGDIVTVTVNRNGKVQQMDVELRNQDGNTGLAKKSDDFFMSDLGATLEAVPQSEMNKLRLTHGLKVTDIQDGMLKKGGVQNGFIIQEINGVKVRSKEDVNQALKNVRSGIIRIEGIYPNGMRMNYGFIL